MNAPDFMDELDCGSFFDHIDDLLVDFSGDDVDAAGGGGLGSSKPESNPFPSIWSTQSDSLPNSDSVFSGHSASADLSAELSVPYEDIVQLEWLSNFVEDSFSGGESLTINNNNNNNNNREQQDSTHNHHRQFQTSSPISVLESSSSCSGGEKSTVSGGASPETATPGGRRGRARSKRPRPAAFHPRPAMHLIEEPSVFVPTPKCSSDSSDSFAESRPATKPPKPSPVADQTQIKKKKKIKLSFPAAQSDGSGSGSGPASSLSVRKCMHCEITKTPQWRAGPMGPKTLCNACGVRFKSGRLFPEYRPAASPTFVPSLHSNSHKKVLEMRVKDFDNVAFSGSRAELVPNASLGYI